ncbi:MAG: GntR family transcriptional regulator [Thalassobaculum sp.]|uniref:GntR family transcriptional regulator n=1 Tax=Thalassobaculum sp. TaxID=2022740 RepID=UPI0032ECE8EF
MDADNRPASDEPWARRLEPPQDPAIRSLERLDASSLSERVYSQLRAALMRGELVPEQRLKIGDVAERLGTSETPVREAFFQLAREGALEIKPRHYVRVRRLSAGEYLQVRDIRLQLEPLAAERALPHIRPEDVAALRRVHARLVEAEATKDYPAAVQANFEFHFGLYLRSSMPILIETLESLWVRAGPLFNFLYPHGHPTYDGPHQHETVLAAMERQDSYMLREAIRQDLIEGGRNFVRHLQAMEGAGAAK